MSTQARRHRHVEVRGHRISWRYLAATLALAVTAGVLSYAYAPGRGSAAPTVVRPAADTTGDAFPASAFTGMLNEGTNPSAAAALTQPSHR